VNSLHFLEGGPSQEATIPAAVAHVLSERKICDLVALGNDRYLVSPGFRIGIVNINGFDVRIDAKLDINQLVYLIGFAPEVLWDHGPIELAPDDNLVDVLVQAFLQQATLAVRPGLLQGYHEREDELAVVRGRLRDQDQLRRRFGIALPLLVRYDEYSVDIAENQLLALACHRLLRMGALKPKIANRVRQLHSAFGDVSPALTTPQWQPTRLNERYQTALHLAQLIVDATSFSQHDGHIRSSGFLVNMAKVFEKFIEGTLTTALKPHGGVTNSQGVTFLDQAEEVGMKPDLVWKHGDTARAVVDAKYKAEKPSGFPYADLYQLLAYCTALDLQHGDLIYAKGNESAQRHQIVNAGITIHCHAVDLTLHHRYCASRSIKSQTCWRRGILLCPILRGPVRRSEGLRIKLGSAQPTSSPHQVLQSTHDTVRRTSNRNSSLGVSVTTRRRSACDRIAMVVTSLVGRRAVAFGGLLLLAGGCSGEPKRDAPSSPNVVQTSIHQAAEPVLTEADIVEPIARKLFGDDFAGISVVNGNLTVYKRGAVPNLARTELALVRVEAVTYSLNELDAIRKKIDANSAALRRSGVALLTVGVDPKTNSVMVDVSDDLARAKVELANFLGPAAPVTIREEPKPIQVDIGTLVPTSVPAANEPH
jgi:5-methylcytosine-specific restriction enzyme subunit McrC